MTWPRAHKPGQKLAMAPPRCEFPGFASTSLDPVVHSLAATVTAAGAMKVLAGRGRVPATVWQQKGSDGWRF